MVVAASPTNHYPSTQYNVLGRAPARALHPGEQGRRGGDAQLLPGVERPGAHPALPGAAESPRRGGRGGRAAAVRGGERGYGDEKQTNSKRGGMCHDCVPWYTIIAGARSRLYLAPKRVEGWMRHCSERTERSWRAKRHRRASFVS